MMDRREFLRLVVVVAATAVVLRHVPKVDGGKETAVGGWQMPWQFPWRFGAEAHEIYLPVVEK